MDIRLPDGFWHHYRVPIVLGVSSIVLVGISIVLLFKSANSHTIRFHRMRWGASPSARSGSITIDVEGRLFALEFYRFLPTVGWRTPLRRGRMRQDADREYVAQKIEPRDESYRWNEALCSEAWENKTSHNKTSQKWI
jgi:hypothetical protein